RGLELALQLVQRLAQDLRVGALDGHGEHLGTLYVHRLRAQVGALARDELQLEARKLLLQRALLLEHPAQRLLDHAGTRLRAQLARHLAELLQLLVDQAERALAGRGLDAADAGRDAALGIDLEESDVAGARDVRAAAEFARGADVEHAHLVAVLLAEEHHGAGALRLLDRHDLRARRRVLQDLGVDARLDLADLLLAHRLAMREVEARLVGVDERAALLDVAAEHVAQRLVHEVRDRVVAHRAPAKRAVDASLDAVADLQATDLERAVVAEDLRLDLLGVVHRERAARGDELAAVAHLA